MGLSFKNKENKINFLLGEVNNFSTLIRSFLQIKSYLDGSLIKPGDIGGNISTADHTNHTIHGFSFS